MTESDSTNIYATSLVAGQTIIASSFAHGPATITSVEPSSLYGSATVIVKGTENGDDREWILYANETVTIRL